MFDMLLARASGDGASVGDLLAFDALVATLTDDQQLTIARKIAHEASEGEPAQRSEDLQEQVDYLERQTEVDSQRIAALNKELDDLRPLAQRAQSATEACTQMEANLGALRNENARLVIEQAQALQQAEVRGYRRGLEDRAA